MSKYKILRVDHYDPIAVGKRRRRINIMFAVIAMLSAPIIILIHLQFNVGIDETNLMLMILYWGLLFLLFRKFKIENNKYKTIGDIEFTRKRVIKRIGDTFSENSYDSIESIELQKHIPASLVSESKSGFYTYILSIKFKDSHKDSIIVSDRPLDKMQNISITDTIKALKRIVTTRINII
jgi:hypothetical protein